MRAERRGEERSGCELADHCVCAWMCVCYLFLFICSLQPSLASPLQNHTEVTLCLSQTTPLCHYCGTLPTIFSCSHKFSLQPDTPEQTHTHWRLSLITILLTPTQSILMTATKKLDYVFPRSIIPDCWRPLALLTEHQPFCMTCSISSIFPFEEG